MICTIYTNEKYASLLKKVSVKNVEFNVIITDKKYTTFETKSKDENNKDRSETIIKWGEIKLNGDFSGIIISSKDYKIRSGLCGVSDGFLFQVFAKTNNARNKDTIKHELLHCIARKFNKEDKLHEYLNAGNTLEDFENYLWSRSNSELIFEQARAKVGQDASPADLAPDELGCAESVSNIINAITPFPIILSTKTLYETLCNDNRFERTLELKKGNILTSPTGYGTGHGHTGIIGEYEVIYSNDSNTGTWQPNYTIKSWVNYFRKKKGFPLFVFKMK